MAGSTELVAAAAKKKKKRRVLTCAVLVDLHRPVVHLRHGLHLDVVAVTVVFPFPVDVCGEVFCHVV